MFSNRKQIFDPYSEPKSNVEFLALTQAHKDPYTVEVLGVQIVVYPEVLSPKYEWVTQFHIQNMVSAREKRVLDIGTGTGAIALFCAMQGASLVHATDINPNAVANARANFEKHNFKEDRCLAYHSDLFENISREFDVIHFNPPFQGFRAKNMLDRALTDENYSTVTRFMSGVGGHLSEGGIICVTWSDLGDMTLIERLIEDNGFVVESFFEEQREWSSFLIGLKRKCCPTMTY